MRLLITTPYYPPHVGGVETYVQRIAQALADRPDWEVRVITTESDGETSPEDYPSLRVDRLSAQLRVSNTPLSLRWVGDLSERTKDFRPDAVITHAPVPGMAEATLLAANQAPVILTYHSGSLKKGVLSWDAIVATYERTVLRWMLERSRTVITYSPQFSQMLRVKSIPHHIIPPGVDVEAFTPVQGVRERSPVVIYVGRMDKSSRWKGLTVLIDAMAEVIASHPGAKLELVGEGDDVPYLRHYASERRLHNVVHFRGTLGGDALVRAYQRAAVAALPSLTEAESFGICMLEASACGVPTVGSRIGGIPRVVRHGSTGLLVDPGNPIDLASAIHRILDDEVLAERLGKAGRKMACEEFTWIHQAELTSKVIEEIAA